jgi:hypothetical protein
MMLLTAMAGHSSASIREICAASYRRPVRSAT